jgi:Variant SH3 domain
MLINPGSPISPGGKKDSMASLLSHYANGTENHILPAAQRASVSANVNAENTMLVSPFATQESFAFPTPPPRQSPVLNSPKWVTVTPRQRMPVSITPSVLINAPEAAVLVGAHPGTPQYSPTQSLNSLQVNDAARSNDSLPSVTADEQISPRPRDCDELSVVTGDSINLLQTFGDGWAFVEKGGERGLVPLDCLSGDEHGSV